MGRSRLGRRFPWAILGILLGTHATSLHAQSFPQTDSGAANIAPQTTAAGEEAPPPAATAPRYVQVVEQAEPAANRGQIWHEYDLRPHLLRVRGLEHPEQPIIEWVLRETGTDNWFGEVPGLLSFEGERLRVYHVPAVQDVVADIADRFVNPELSKYTVAVRLVTVQNTGWRAMALPLMNPIPVETAGLQAWTLSRENAARLGAQLRTLPEYRVHNSDGVQIGHGQSHVIERWQPRTYPERLQPTPNNYPGYQIAMGEIQEGFRLEISPLAASDGTAMEVVIKCHADQIERMAPVSLGSPTGNSLFGGNQIQVPQISSWRMHERFRWPTDQVLVVSRGMVAMPGLQTTPAVPLTSVLPSGPPRADVLLVFDCKLQTGGGDLSQGEATRVGRVNHHGRY